MDADINEQVLLNAVKLELQNEPDIVFSIEFENDASNVIKNEPELEIGEYSNGFNDKQADNSNSDKWSLQKDTSVTKTTNSNQFDIMVRFMNKHHKLARGHLTGAQHKAKSQALWEELTDKLNTEGPPIKKSDQWKKVWKDYKYNIKKKITQNKVNRSQMGGGKSDDLVLNQREVSIAHILEIQNEIADVPTHSYVIVEKDDHRNMETDTETIVENHLIFNETNELESTDRADSMDISLKRKRTTQKDLLKTQVENQCKYQKDVCRFNTKIVRELKEIRKLKEREIELKEMKLKLLKTEICRKEEYRKEKLTLLKTKLSIKKLH